MSKIVKKKDLDVLIESTLEKAGIKIVNEEESKFKKALEKVKKSGEEYPKKEDLSKEKSSKLQLLQLRVKNNPEEYTEDELVSKIKKIMEESTSSDKSLINEELMRFNKLSNYTYKK